MHIRHPDWLKGLVAMLLLAMVVFTLVLALGNHRAVRSNERTARALAASSRRAHHAMRVNVAQQIQACYASGARSVYILKFDLTVYAALPQHRRGRALEQMERIAQDRVDYSFAAQLSPVLAGAVIDSGFSCEQAFR